MNLYFDQVIEEFESHLDGWHDSIDLLGEDVLFSEALSVLRPEVFDAQLAGYIDEHYRTVIIGDEVIYIWRD